MLVIFGHHFAPADTQTHAECERACTGQHCQCKLYNFGKHHCLLVGQKEFLPIFLIGNDHHGTVTNVAFLHHATGHRFKSVSKLQVESVFNLRGSLFIH